MFARITAIGLLGLLWSGLVLAAEDSTKRSLQESMIWARSAPPGQQAYVAFRKSFSLSQLPKEATLHIFADTRYILWVNGQYVLRGPCRFDPKRPEYDSVDLRTFLRAGPNVLAILVHHYAGGSNSKVMEHVPGLTVQLEVLGESLIHTDSTWRCCSRTRYLPSPPAWGSIPDVIDARQESGDWTKQEFDDSSWDSSVRVDGSKWGTLCPRSLPLLRESEMTDLRVLPSNKTLTATLPLELTSGTEIVIDLGRMAMAYGVVDLEADKGSVLQIRYWLRLVNGRPEETYGSGTTYTARVGRQSFITGDEWVCHYVTVRCVSGRIKMHGLKMIDRRYPFNRVGSFRCSDDVLTRLWEIGVNTIEVATDDGYGMDGRERNEWLQDPAQPNFLPTRVALAGPAPDGKAWYSDPRLLKNLMRHIALSQTPDGRLKAHACSDRWDVHGYIEDFSCQWVESLRMYFDATSDKAFVREMWPVLVRQMKWFLDRRTLRGLVLAREYASFDNPVAYVTCEGATLNAFVYRALKDSAYLGQAIGESQSAADYEQAAADLAQAFNKYLWNEAEGTYNSAFYQDKVLGPTAHAALLAMDRGIVPENRLTRVRRWFLANYKRPGAFLLGSSVAVEERVNQRLGINMPVTYYWAFQELYRMNSPEADLESLTEIRRRWSSMVEQRKDTGTATETFLDVRNGSESCHNYGAMPVYFLSAYVLGVRLDGPVWNKRILIEPRLGDLTWAEGTVVTEHGLVSVSWKRSDSDKKLAFVFKIPQGVRATVRLPKPSTEPSLTINGTTLMTHGKTKDDGLQLEERWLKLELNSGDYTGTIGR